MMIEIKDFNPLDVNLHGRKAFRGKVKVMFPPFDQDGVMTITLNWNFQKRMTDNEVMEFLEEEQPRLIQLWQAMKNDRGILRNA